MPKLSWSVVLFFLVACSSGPRLAPPPPDPGSSYTGIWSGEASDNIGSGRVEMALVQVDESLTGEIILSFSAGLASYSALGTVTGTITGDSVELYLEPDDPDYCPYRAVASRSGDTLQGSYRGVGCRKEIRGTLTLEKE